MNENIDLISVIRRHNFHGADFTFRGTPYSFSGWWILDWSKMDEQDDDSKYKIYDSKEEFLSDPFFDGKTLVEVQGELTDVDYDLEPW